MSCGGNITIYGLFPEDDITGIDTPCDWAVYARPECTVVEYERLPNALWIRDSNIRIPIQDIVDPAQPFRISFKLWNQLPISALDMWESEAFATSSGETEKYFEVEYTQRVEASQTFTRARINTHNDPVADTNYQDIGTYQWVRIDNELDITADTWDMFIENLHTGEPRRDVGPASPITGVIQNFVPENWVLGGYFRVNNVSQFADIEIWQNDQLLAYWPLDEGTGTIFFDRTGNGNDLVAEDFGLCLWGDQHYVQQPKMLQFDGSSTYIEIPWGDVTEIVDSFGMGLRVIAIADDAAKYPIFSRDGSVLTDPDHYLWEITFVNAPTVTGTSHLEMASGTYSGGFSAGSRSVQVGEKNQLFFGKATSPGITTTAYQYPDPDVTTGVDTANFNVGTTDWNNFVSTGTLLIGCNNDKTTFFKGKMRNIVLYPINTSGAYVNGLPYAWYTLDDDVADGGVIHDRSGNGRHGILHLGGGSWVTAQ